MKFSMNFLFLLIVPFLCEGSSVQLSMPSYADLRSSEITVTCNFTTAVQLVKMTLLRGGDEIIAHTGNGKYELASNGNISLKIGAGTTEKKGSLNFIIPHESCADFTWYMCRGTVLGSTEVDSENKTLRVLPQVTDFRNLSTSKLAVGELARFHCVGTIDKESPYSVKWYRVTTNSSNEIKAMETNVTGEDQCSRSVSSTVGYVVGKFDRPNFDLLCQIENGLVVNETRTFSGPVPTITVKLELPKYIGYKSPEIRVTCRFTSNLHISNITLLHGDNKITASYNILEGMFKILPPDRIALEVGQGTNRENGFLTFVFSSVTCNNFTSYTCRAEETLESKLSGTKTLQASLNVAIVSKANVRMIPHRSYSFVCKGTVHKEGSFSVQWYRNSVRYYNKLTAEKTGVTGEDRCSRDVSSHLTYTVTESDEERLKLWCRIETGITSSQTGRSFSIKVKGGAGDLKESTLLVLAVAFVACALDLF